MGALGRLFGNWKAQTIAGRLKIVLVVGVAMLTIGVGAAYGVLGYGDTAYGTNALASENGGNWNAAFGYNALFSNTSGEDNSAVGFDAMYSNTTGQHNSAFGAYALSSNTTGCCNMAAGRHALLYNTTGHDNAATGFQALHWNTTGSDNTATGANALDENGTGSANVAVGRDALYYNSSGSNNTAVGRSAGVGAGANTTGSQNTYLGYNSGPTDHDLDNATAIGANAIVSQSNSLVLGAAGVNVGINNTRPASRLQVGSVSDGFGDYLQLPVVVSTAKTPPVSHCNATFLGRVVVIVTGSKWTLQLCTHLGWKKLR